MRTTIKKLFSAFVLAFFLLIAWATSVEDDNLDPSYVGFLIKNQSDSCTINGLRLIHRVRRDNIDTLSRSGFEIPPGDSVYLYEEALKFQRLLHTCQCPDTSFTSENPIQLDTVQYQDIILELKCD